MTDQPVLMFLHLLKTAGTAVRWYFERALPEPSRIIHLGDQPEFEAAQSRLGTQSDYDNSRIRIVFGHFAGSMRPLFPNARHITMMREPTERLFSQYVYQRHNAHALGIRPEDRPLPGEAALDDIADRVIEMGLEASGRYIELQARTMTDFLGEPADSVTRGSLPGIISRFDTILMQRHFALSIFLLHEKYALPLIPVPMVYSYSDLVANYLPVRYRAAYRKHGALEIELYDLAEARFQEEVDRLFAGDAAMTLKWEIYRKRTAELMDHQISDLRAQRLAGGG